MSVCKKCETVISGETTVGSLIKEGYVLQRECFNERTRNDTKLMQAMDKYYSALTALKEHAEIHAECVKSVENYYEDIYRSIQGSRA